MFIEKEDMIDVIKYLLHPDSPRWSTATDIIAKLNLKDINAARLDSALACHYDETGGQSIRFSVLPSKKNLEVLWGHVDKVGRKAVFSIFREDPQTHFLESEIGDRKLNIKNLFLSHSFMDTSLVIELAKSLKEYGIYSWLAEIDILYRAHIHQSVIEAIESTPYFGVFISANSSKSTWTAKEIGFAIRNEKKIIGFINTEDPNWKDIFSYHQNHIRPKSKISQDIFRESERSS